MRPEGPGFGSVLCGRHPEILHAVFEQGAWRFQFARGRAGYGAGPKAADALAAAAASQLLLATRVDEKALAARPTG